MNRFIAYSAIALLSLACAVAQADKYDANKVVTAQTKEAFSSQAESVRKEMQNGGRYEFVTPTEHSRVEHRLSEIQNLFDKYTEGTRLQDTKMVELLTAQEEINGILNKRDGDRLICKNEMPTGSHRPVNNCKKFSEIEHSRRQTEKMMSNYGATPCDGKACISH
jgi:hypothetical protein